MKDSKSFHTKKQYILDMTYVAKILLAEHDEINRFKAGFAPYQKCQCKACRLARKWVEEVEYMFLLKKEDV